MSANSLARRRARRAQDPEVQARAAEHARERAALRSVELRRRAAERKAAGDRDGFRSLLREARRAERGE